MFPDDLAAAMRLARDPEMGALRIDEPGRVRLGIQPCGGVKEGGIGRAGLRDALSQITFIGIRP